MKFQISKLFLIIAGLASCHEDSSSGDRDNSHTIKAGQRSVQYYTKRGVTTYFVVKDSDTSSLKLSFRKNSQDSLEADILEDNNLSYREEQEELKLILEKASRDLSLSSLSRIWGIPLSMTGDLAILLTKKFVLENPKNSLDNSVLSKFLLTSKLTDDLNALLLPYGKRIKKYEVEKARLIDNSYFFRYNKIETPKSEIPATILEADIWPIIENN